MKSTSNRRDIHFATRAAARTTTLAPPLRTDGHMRHHTTRHTTYHTTYHKATFTTPRVMASCAFRYQLLGVDLGANSLAKCGARVWQFTLAGWNRKGDILMRTLLGLFISALLAMPTSAQVLDKQKLLDRETFWDNRDWNWYKANIPFFECPDVDIQTTYYYRWELLTKHLTYGSPNTGYVFTEFIDRPFWSGTYGAISCPAGHQLYEARWLCDPHYVRDYSRYWFRTPGAQPRRYSTWLADAIWAAHLVHPDLAFAKDLLPDLVKNYRGWEKEHFVPEVGLFWQTGHDDGMEININSRQTKDTVRGAPGYRPTLNSYMYADALAIAQFADLVGEPAIRDDYRAKAAALKKNLQSKLWDPKREFFFPMYKQDEERDGFKIKTGSLTYQTGKFAGDAHGREEIGFVPWQFNLPDRGYEAAWKTLMSKDGFFADFGPTTVERHDPQFEIAKQCCEWSGNSWPYATTQTLKAMANLLQNYDQKVVTRDDYLKLLQVYAKTHRKNGKPYLAEACHPDTGSWEGNDSYNHSEHYFHSDFNDLVITGLVGIEPSSGDSIQISPLAPNSWDYFALDGIEYHGREIAIIWDRTGTRYGKGAGLHVFANRERVATSPKLGSLSVKLPFKPNGFIHDFNPGPRMVNYAVNNDGTYYPRIRASYTAPGTSPMKLIDGNYWYHRDPPNRWTCAGSPNASDWVEIDFGTERLVEKLQLYFLDDGEGIVPPERVFVEVWDGKKWVALRETPAWKAPVGRRPNFVGRAWGSKLRATFTHRAGGRTWLTEIEAWGRLDGEYKPAPMPAGNLAQGAKASASFTSRFDNVAMANDGIVNFNAGPANRWTSYESPNASDWLEIDFGAEKDVGRVELAIYDDRGGVQAPTKYAVQWWDGKAWRDVANAKHSPEKPAGGQWNEATFDHVKTPKVRVVFTHAGKARSGVSEVLIWRD
jgi:hypothetical protein